MQMRVHRLFIVGILPAESNVLQGCPIPVECFEISAKAGVEAMFFYKPVKFYCLIQHTLIADGLAIFAETVEGKGLPIDLLARIQRLAGSRHRPIGAAVLFVEEKGRKVFISPGGHWPVDPLSRGTPGGAKSPQDAGIQDQSPGSLLIAPIVLIYPADKSAPPFVRRIQHPIFENGL